MRWLVFALFLSWIALVTRTSIADDASQLKAQADAAMDAHHYDEAVDAYTKAYELNPDPALLYNRGRAHEALSRYPAALDDIEKFAEIAPPALRARVPKLSELLNGLRARVGTLQIACNVAGARVLANGKDLGATPLSHTRLNAGKITLEVLEAEHLPYKRDIDLAGGATVMVDVALAAKATQGILAIRTVPAGATILVDDKPFGTSPTEGPLGIGRHGVLARGTGLEDARGEAVIEAGQRREIQLELAAKKRSVFASPIFWTIVGVLVVGGATAAIVGALTTERSPDIGVGFMPGHLGAP